MSRDAHSLLLRALVRWAGEGATIGATRGEPWASATFSGMRHRIALRLADARADRIARDIGEAEFDLPGHLLADIMVADRQRTADGGTTLHIEALTVEAA